MPLHGALAEKSQGLNKSLAHADLSSVFGDKKVALLPLVVLESGSEDVLCFI